MVIRQSFIIIVLILLVSGCAEFHDYSYRTVNRMRSKEAWTQIRKEHPDAKFSGHYANGWKEGYFDLSTGSDGTPPVVPPKRYWTTTHQNPHGQRIVEEWYRGYQDGTIAAEQDGRQHWHFIPSLAPRMELLPSATLIETDLESVNSVERQPPELESPSKVNPHREQLPDASSLE